MRRVAAVLAVGALATVPAGSRAAEFKLGAGAIFDVGSAILDLGCGDLVVAGTWMAGEGGSTEARNYSIDSSGVLDGDSATLGVKGDWTNAGTFHAGSSTARFVDGCGVTSADIVGDSVFHDLEMETSNGTAYRIETGSTQTVTGALSLQGAEGALLTLRSTVGGETASLEVQGSGAGNYVDVDDIDASGGNPISLGQDSVTGTNTPGWMLTTLVPTFGILGRTLLVVLMGAIAVSWLRRRPHRGERAGA